MNIYMHKDCREEAVERLDPSSSEIPTGYPFNCLSCLGEIEDVSDLYIVEVMSQ